MVSLPLTFPFGRGPCEFRVWPTMGEGRIWGSVGARNASQTVFLELQPPRPAGVEQEDLTVAHAAGPGRARDPVRNFVDPVVADPNGNLDLGHEGIAVLAADVAIQITLLAA